jgi:hypothetical protein
MVFEELRLWLEFAVRDGGAGCFVCKKTTLLMPGRAELAAGLSPLMRATINGALHE